MGIATWFRQTQQQEQQQQLRGCRRSHKSNSHSNSNNNSNSFAAAAAPTREGARATASRGFAALAAPTYDPRMSQLTIPAAPAFAWFAPILALLGACSLVSVDSLPAPGDARISVAVQSDGKPAVVLDTVSKRFGFRTQVLDNHSPARSLAIAPGRYVLGLECLRPGGMSLVDLTPSFTVTVEAGGSYVLDCQPAGMENNFQLMRVAE